MSISVKLLESNAEISRKVKKALAKDLNIVLNKNKGKIERKIRALIPAWVQEQPEISSLLDEGVFGSLNAQFGFFSGTAAQAVSAISLAVANSTVVTFEKISDTLSGGVTLNVQPNSFAELLELPEGYIPALSGPLYWLNWLLLEGNRTLVIGYSYQPDTSGRSGGGVMTYGRSWRVPAEFAGTADNNFVTRALSNREKELSAILKETVYG